MFSTEKETINKIKKQPTKWEKIFASNEINKGLISKTYKQLMWLYIKKKKKTLNLGKGERSRHFSKEIYRWPSGTWKYAQYL